MIGKIKQLRIKYFVIIFVTNYLKTSSCSVRDDTTAAFASDFIFNWTVLVSISGSLPYAVIPVGTGDNRRSICPSLSSGEVLYLAVQVQQV